MNAQIGIDCSTRVNTVPIVDQKVKLRFKKRRSNNCNLHF